MKKLWLAPCLLVPFLAHAVDIPDLPTGGTGTKLGDPVNTESLPSSRSQSSGVGALDYRDSPINPDNSAVNPDNTSIEWRNNPVNPDNSPIFPDNPRIIRDNNGNAVGYAVPKVGGGTNYFDFNGNRTGYDTGR